MSRHNRATPIHLSYLGSKILRFRLRFFTAIWYHAKLAKLAKMTTLPPWKEACVGRPSASISRFPGTGVGVVPRADVFVDAHTVEGAPHLPPGRHATAAKWSFWLVWYHSYCKSEPKSS